MEQGVDGEQTRMCSSPARLELRRVQREVFAEQLGQLKGMGVNEVEQYTKWKCLIHCCY